MLLGVTQKCDVTFQFPHFNMELYSYWGLEGHGVHWSRICIKVIRSQLQRDEAGRG